MKTPSQRNLLDTVTPIIPKTLYLSELQRVYDWTGDVTGAGSYVRMKDIAEKLNEMTSAIRN